MKNKIIPLSLIFIFLLAIGMAWGAGETPSRIYIKYMRAIQSGDFDAMLSFLAKSERSRVDCSDAFSRGRKIAQLQDSIPKEIKVIKEEIGSTRASLILEAVNHNGYGDQMQHRTGKIEFILEEGQWRIVREQWETK